MMELLRRLSVAALVLYAHSLSLGSSSSSGSIVRRDLRRLGGSRRQLLAARRLVVRDATSLPDAAAASSQPPDDGEVSAALKRNVEMQTTLEESENVAFSSNVFWAEIIELTPGLAEDTRYDRVRGFIDNLRRGETKIVKLSSGQEIMERYYFPGLPERTGPFDTQPHEHTSVLKRAADFAKAELQGCLESSPLRDDDGVDTSSSKWTRAAWFGWQFLDIDAARSTMPLTWAALSELPLGHRFVGIARQRANCTGTWHSDHRNYMLSSLTGVRVPESCGVRARGELRLLGECTVYLDNTFSHQVYNDAPEDRFVLMTEVWHPSLHKHEALVVETIFAALDKFSLLHRGIVPAGITKADLEQGAKDNSVYTVDFYKRRRGNKQQQQQQQQATAPPPRSSPSRENTDRSS